MAEIDRRIPPQDHFDPNYMAVLNAAYPNPIPFEPGAQIIQQGASGDDERDLFVVAGGSARVVINGANISIGPGGFFGEMVLMGHLINQALGDVDEKEKVNIVRSADVFAGEDGLMAIQLSPEIVLRWRDKGYPYSDMYRVVSEQAQHRTAMLRDREEIGMTNVWSNRLLPEPQPKPQFKIIEPEAPIEAVVAPTLPSRDVFIANPNGVLGRRLMRPPTNS